MHAITAHIRAAGFALAAAAALVTGGGGISPARAQSIAATVNDSPITTYDLEQRVRLLRVLRQPATPAAALESLVEDRLKAAETRKYGINPSNQDAAQELARLASERKISGAALGGALQSARVDTQHWQEHGKAQIGWRGYVAAINKNVGVSEIEVRAELQRKGVSKVQEFILRPVVFIVPRNAGPGVAEARGREAANFRSRFTDCESGLQFARSLRDVAIRPVVRRSLSSLPDAMAQTVERTAVGRLTPPARSADGIEMIAVCGKGGSGTDTSAADEIRQTLLAKKLEGASERLYAPLRKRAIIVKR